MNRKEKIDLVNDGYYRLVLAVDNVNWRHYAEELLALEKGYERKHREFTNCEYIFNGNTASKYWCVYHILGELDKTEEPNIKSFLHLKQSIFLASSLVANYREKIEKEFEGFDIEAFNKINITEWKEGEEA